MSDYFRTWCGSARTWCWSVGLSLAIGIIGCGCKSTGNSPPKGMVVISNTNPGVVRGAATEVFEGQGFKLRRYEKGLLVFEKQASGWNNVAYGNWMESKVWERYKLTVETLSENTVRLHGMAYVVRDRGGTTEEEIKNYRQKNYHKLLEEVAVRLKSPERVP